MHGIVDGFKIKTPMVGEALVLAATTAMGICNEISAIAPIDTQFFCLSVFGPA